MTGARHGALVLVLCLTGYSVHAAERGTADNPLKVAFTTLKAKGVEPALAENLTEVTAAGLSADLRLQVLLDRDMTALLELEQRQQLLGCEESACLAELGGALGVAKIVSGSVGKIEDTFLLSMQLLDVHAAKIEKRVVREVRGGEHELIEAVKDAARLLADTALAIDRGEPGFDQVVDYDKDIRYGDVKLALKLGNVFSSLFDNEVSMSQMLWTVHLEGDWFLHKNVPIFAQISVNIARALKDDEGNERIVAIPLAIGVKYQDDLGIVQPYVGLGLGSQVAFGTGATDREFTIHAFLAGGLDIMLHEHFCLLVEAGGVFSQIQIEHNEEEDKQKTRGTFNLGGLYLSLGALARF